jgi:hypothetical protein
MTFRQLFDRHIFNTAVGRIEHPGLDRARQKSQVDERNQQDKEEDQVPLFILFHSKKFCRYKIGIYAEFS